MSKKLSKVVAVQQQELGGSSNSIRDPHRNRTVLHLAALGSTRLDQNNTFVDDSPNRYTIIRNGNVAPSTFTPFGDSWSNYFDGSGDYLSTADNAAFELGSGDFTIEAWINPQQYSSIDPDSAYNSMICYKASSYGMGLAGTASSFTSFFMVYRSGGVWGSSSANYDFSLGRWYHIAIARQGSNLRFFVDGSLIATRTVSFSTENSTSAFFVGAQNASGYNRWFGGYISNFRLVKGTAVYTSAFTPPKSPLTAISGTSLLTCASNRFQDKSSNNFAITPVGNVVVKTTSPFPQAKPYVNRKTGYSISFNGSTQRMETPASSEANGLQLGTSDFTIECWVKAKPQSNFARVIDSCAYGNPNVAFVLATPISGVSSDLSFGLYTGAGLNYDGFPLPNALTNTWNHIAIVRISNTIFGYVNGSLVGSDPLRASNQNINYVTPVTIGVAKSPTAGTYSNYFSGKISNVRITKSALYNGNFTPEDSPLLLASGRGLNASLLTCQSQSIRDNSYNSHTLTTAGTPTVDSDSPFNQDDELSYYFDGNGDYLSIADNAALEIGSGDFTIETWFNSSVAAKTPVNSDGTYHFALADKLASYQWLVTGTSTGFDGFYMTLYNGSSWQYVSTSYNFQANTWYHLAVSRQSGVMKLFVNGVLLNSGAVTHTASNNANALRIGVDSGLGTSYAFNGYMSNFRLVVGTALYTSSFTPSRKPLPVVSGTSLLTCRGRTAIDDSTNALTVTAVGNANISRRSPFRKDDSLGGSYYFDGTDDILSINGALPLHLPANFTIEFWVYRTSTASSQRLLNYGGVASLAAHSWLVSVSTTAVLSFAICTSSSSSTNDFTLSTPANSINLGEWNHVAITRSSTQFRIYINGVQRATGTSSVVPYNPGTRGLSIGGRFNHSWQSASGIDEFVGYASNISIQKDVVKYTSTFTPPTSPDTYPDVSTSLRVLPSQAIYDTTRRNVIETIGNASTGVETKGLYNGIPGVGPQSALYFDGTGDYLKIPDSDDFNFGSGDFTIEAWVMPLKLGAGSNAIFNQSSGGASSDSSIFFGVGTDGAGIWISDGVSWDYNALASISLTNAFTHIAAVRSGTSLMVFTGGILRATTTIPSGFTLANSSRFVEIGIQNSSDSPFYGALHDLRVTKGVARYTANFTPPKGSLPIK
jgi:hypothetical protein